MNKKFLSLALVAALAFGTFNSCKKAFEDDDTVTPSSTGSTETAQNNGATVDETVDEVVAEEATDYVFDESTGNKIIGKTSYVEVEGTGATANGSVATITKSGDYIVEGDLSNGQIVVDVDDTDEGTVKIILNGMDFASSDGAPLYIDDCKKVSVLIADGTENSFESTYSGTDTVGCIHSKQDIFFSAGELATGTLTVTASNYEAIKSKDGIVINSGNITATSNGNDAIQGKDYVKIDGGTITATGANHAIKASNDNTDMGFVYITGGTLKLNGGKDAIHAVGTIQIKDGTFSITATDDGISSDSHVTIDGGTFNAISTSDKGINAAGTITINGGDFTILKSDKCIAADGDITINDGNFTLTPTVSTSGSESGSGHGITSKKLDSTSQRVGNVTINGGTINITKSYEGIQGVIITFNGGVTKIVSSDDAVNASTGSSSMGGGMWGGSSSSSTTPSLVVNDGFLYAVASGDGYDSNGTMYFNGGVAIVSQNSSNNEPLDAGDNYSPTITGGVVLAIGSQGMASAPAATQTAFYTTVSGSANKYFAVNDADGNNIFALKAPMAYSIAKGSAPELTTGTYTIITDATVTGTQYVEGVDFYYPADKAEGTSAGTLSLTSGKCTSSSNSSGMGGGSNQPGGNGGRNQNGW